MQISAASGIPVDDVLSAKWSIAILRILSRGPERFCNIKSKIPKVSANVLTSRLRSLEEHGVIERVDVPETPERMAYQLAARGKPVRSVIKAIDEWRAESVL